MMIEEICKKAKAEGLTYGQYVAKHKAELAGMRAEPELHDGYRICRNPNCRKEFTPTNSRQVFCRTSCRVSYNQKKRREKQKWEGEDDG